MEVLVCPVLAESLNEDVAVLLPAPVHFLVEGKCAADFTVDLGVLDFLRELASIQVVGKSCVGVIEVLKLGSVWVSYWRDLPLDNELALASDFANVLIELDHRDILGEVSDVDRLLTGWNLV